MGRAAGLKENYGNDMNRVLQDLISKELIVYVVHPYKKGNAVIALKILGHCPHPNEGRRSTDNDFPVLRTEIIYRKGSGLLGSKSCFFVCANRSNQSKKLPKLEKIGKSLETGTLMIS